MQTNLKEFPKQGHGAPTVGKGQHHDKSWWMSFIQVLVAAGYLSQTSKQFWTVINVEQKSREWLMKHQEKGEPLNLILPDELLSKPKPKPALAAPDTPTSNPQLRAVRYFLLSDCYLMTIANSLQCHPSSAAVH